MDAVLNYSWIAFAQPPPGLCPRQNGKDYPLTGRVDREYVGRRRSGTVMRTVRALLQDIWRSYRANSHESLSLDGSRAVRYPPPFFRVPGRGTLGELCRTDPRRSRQPAGGRDEGSCHRGISPGLPVFTQGLAKTVHVPDSYHETGDVLSLPALDMGRDVFQPVQSPGKAAPGVLPSSGMTNPPDPACFVPEKPCIPPSFRNN